MLNRSFATLVIFCVQVKVVNWQLLPDVQLPGLNLKNCCLRWYGHVRRSSMCIKDVLVLPLPGGRFRDRPAKTWLSCVVKDMEFYGLENANPLNKAEWRKCISPLLYTPATGKPTAV